MDRQSSYSRTRERLEEIVTQIKAKDLPLEKSLDLYEEALRLGSACAEMIDRTDFSAEELAAGSVEDGTTGYDDGTTEYDDQTPEAKDGATEADGGSPDDGAVEDDPTGDQVTMTEATVTQDELQADLDGETRDAAEAMGILHETGISDEAGHADHKDIDGEIGGSTEDESR